MEQQSQNGEEDDESGTLRRCGDGRATSDTAFAFSETTPLLLPPRPTTNGILPSPWTASGNSSLTDPEHPMKASVSQTTPSRSS